MKYRKNIRLKGYDYGSDGYYFITICYSHLAVKYVAAERSSANSNSKADALMLQSNKYYSIIEKHLKNLERYQGVKLDYYQIMPNHIHFILVMEKAKLSLCRYIQIFKSQSTLEIKNNGFNGERLWQPNYYEHVIRNEKALNKIREYIQNNPLQEKISWKEVYNVENIM